jgi:Leucine-rich repeat (LRR) protein
MSSVDLSERYTAVEHSFTGIAEQKSAATVVGFQDATQVDFLPKEILNEFPKLNGIRIENCNTLTTIREDFFSDEFKVIQYLDLYRNKIETIETNAFQHLPNLKWIGLASNELHSLPHQLFKNNLEIIVIWLWSNNIISITPDFFKNLNKLQYVDFNPNRCIEKDFGCGTGSCSVSQEELDSGLSACHKNCLDDSECAAKSGKLDNLSSEQITKNLDLN